MFGGSVRFFRSFVSSCGLVGSRWLCKLEVKRTVFTIYVSCVLCRCMCILCCAHPVHVCCILYPYLFNCLSTYLSLHLLMYAYMHIHMYIYVYVQSHCIQQEVDEEQKKKKHRLSSNLKQNSLATVRRKIYRSIHSHLSKN